MKFILNIRKSEILRTTLYRAIGPLFLITLVCLSAVTVEAQSHNAGDDILVLPTRGSLFLPGEDDRQQDSKSQTSKESLDTSKNRGGLKLPGKGDLYIPGEGGLKSKKRGGLFEDVSSSLASDGPNHNQPKQVQFEGHVSHRAIPAGEIFMVWFQINMKDGWHVYGRQETTGRPTQLKLLSPEFEMLEQKISQSKRKEMKIGPETLISYHLDGKAWIAATFRFRKDLISGPEQNLKIRISYQVCSDTICLLPSKKDFSFPITIGKTESNTLTAPVKDLSHSIFPDLFPEIKKEAQAPKLSLEVQDESSGSKLDELVQGNAVLALLFAFLWGLLASLTPCVYPMIPITVSLFSADQDASRATRFMNALAYVFGIAMTYALLGLITSRTGRDLGSWLAEPIVVIPISLMMVALALSMFGLFELDLPYFLKEKLNQLEGRSKFSLLLMGGAMGFIAAPCVGPFAGSIIIWLAKNPGSPVFGFLLMASFGLGMGVLFLLIALFSGEILPRSGMWMVKLKQAMGYVLIGMAIYFLEPLLNDTQIQQIYCLYFLIGGGMMGAFAQLGWDEPWFKHLQKTLGILIFILGLSMGLKGFGVQLPSQNSPAASSANEGEPKVYSSHREALEAISGNNKPGFFYFGAKWCIPCRTFKNVTLKDPRVKKALKDFVFANLDCTQADSEAAQIKVNTYASSSMPFFTFYDSKGKRLKHLEVHGKLETKELLELLAKIR